MRLFGAGNLVNGKLIWVDCGCFPDVAGVVEYAAVGILTFMLLCFLNRGAAPIN